MINSDLFFADLEHYSSQRSERYRCFFDDLERLDLGGGDLAPQDLTELDRWLMDIRLRVVAQNVEDWKTFGVSQALRSACGLFTPMSFGLRETAHTRTLAWLMDPCAEHGFGGVLLEAFLSASGVDWPDKIDFTRPLHVIPERWVPPTDKREAGRCDIWVEGSVGSDEKRSPFLVVVEAKINHHEREDQLSDYEQEIERWQEAHEGGEVAPIFLCRRGSEARTSKYLEWLPLSYHRLTVEFEKRLADLHGKPGEQVFVLYLASLYKEIIGWPTPLDPLAANPFQLADLLRELKDKSTKG